MKLQPIEDHVLIKPINEENTTKSGIILPDSKEKPRKWEVIAVGDGRILDDGSRSAMDVKEWDIVYFTQSYISHSMLQMKLNMKKMEKKLSIW